MSDRAAIVQVHLGKELPPHIYPQLEQSRVTNPSVPTYLIVSETASFDEAAIDRLDVTIVRAEAIRKCRNHRLFSLFNRTNRRAMGGFWLFASERFFAIESFLRACRLRDVVHLENDVMLYADLDGLLPRLSEGCPRIGVTMDSERRCIPGFVFIKDVDALSEMNSFLLKGYLRRRQNDMDALASYIVGADKGACSALPVVPRGYREAYPLENALGQKGASTWYDEAFDCFGGIFDAAALGQFLGGIDKRIAKDAKPGFINETAVYDPRNLGLFWKDESGMRKPYGKIGDREFPVFNLHIHSKDMTEFLSVGGREG
jgi:hypothetical protein